VRTPGRRLLERLDDFPDSILVTGCQRSGTTMLARVITRSDGMRNFWFGRDDELDAALILSGYVEHDTTGRHCFQTTYLNERYPEYFGRSREHTVIWVLRNPYSVVHSLLYHWGRFSRFAFNELFGRWGLSRLLRACLSYNGKVSQLFALKEGLGTSRLLVLEYDELVKHKYELLPRVYAFIDLPFHDDYTERIHAKSVDKAASLSTHERATIERLCMPVYERARSLVSFDS
jgi:hypothetical protein